MDEFAMVWMYLHADLSSFRVDPDFGLFAYCSGFQLGSCCVMEKEF